MELFPLKERLEQEIESIEIEYAHDKNKIERQAELARKYLAEGSSVDVCIAFIRKTFPKPEPHLCGRHPGTPKRRDTRRS
ncbi:MAG TPA: hypothetical protein VEG64_07495 [Candidatus Sulfotelmatobacter sp.]|nr:hypothetical protein [Candidatus Sulfotelmatobacter sp.]